MTTGPAIGIGAVAGLALGILFSVTTGVPLAPEAGLVLGALAGWVSSAGSRHALPAPHPERDSARATSRENSEVVKRFLLPKGTDYTRLFGDDAAWAAVEDANQSLIHDDFTGVFIHSGLEAMEFTGLTGMRHAFREWLGPWRSYHDEIEDVLAVGDDRVVVLGRQHGYLLGAEGEVAADTAAIYYLTDGRIRRLELYGRRAEALEAAGLSG